MPELPEVETIRRVLVAGKKDRPPLPGMKISRAEVFWERSIQVPTSDELVNQIKGQEIIDISRRGKYLIFSLSELFLIIHLRMSGDLWVEENDAERGTHHRIWIIFSQGYRLTFNDPRKFGRIWLVKNPAEVLSRLGPEPFDRDFLPETLYTMLQKKKRQLKPLLLDQSFIAGLGNIYTDESLHLAGLHPNLLSSQVLEEDAFKLWKSIRVTLEQGIQQNGASIDWVFRGGGFQNHFSVYGRVNQPCFTCGRMIVHSVVGQRSTYYCPFCQVLPEDDQL